MAIRAGLRPLKPTLLAVSGIVVLWIATVVVALSVYSSGPAGDVAASETDYRISMPTKLRAGHHTIALTNDGKEGHELLVFRTDLDASDLPVDADGDVVEDAPELELVLDSGDALRSGAGQSLPVTLDPGHYVAACNLPGHYRLGMRLDITVT